MQVDHCEFPDDALCDLENNVWIKLDGKKAIIGIFKFGHRTLAQ